MWIDATIAASFISDPAQSEVADVIAYAQSPVAVTSRGANWLWAWALAVPAGTAQADDAQAFVQWATSKDYITLVGNELGWGSVPTGTRASTYEIADFQAAANFAEAELKAIYSADPSNSTQDPTPYIGVQFAAIPEFQEIGAEVGQQMSAALAGTITVEQALMNSQAYAVRAMNRAGY